MNRLIDKKNIIRQLQEEIMVMEGFRSIPDGRQPCFGLGPVNTAFPGGVFPTGAMHEFLSATEGCAAATNGFIAGLLGMHLQQGGICLWVGAGRKLFPPALKYFGVEPHRVIFTDVRGEKEALWVMEQGLKCSALAAVVAELRDIGFAESRRLQLAVEDSRVTGFLHRCRPYTEHPLACVSRWKVRPLPGLPAGGLPGVGFPRWEVELVKIRNGRPGVWQMEWRDGTFRHVTVRRQAVPEPGSSEKRSYA